LYFFLNGPKPIQAGHKEDMFTHSISAKPQQRPKNRRLSPLSTNFGKKSFPQHPRRFKSLLSIFLLLFATIFVSASFLPKVSKVKERG
jgi:hypothetical protein